MSSSPQTISASNPSSTTRSSRGNPAGKRGAADTVAREKAALRSPRRRFATAASGAKMSCHKGGKIEQWLVKKSQSISIECELTSGFKFATYDSAIISLRFYLRRKKWKK